jgi:deoxycytidylate deaminase
MKAAKSNRMCPYLNRDETWKKDCYIGIDIDEAKNTKSHTQNFIENAVSTAKKSNMTQRHGCVIVHKNKIISFGFNQSFISCKFSIHAEQAAIIKAKKILPRSELKNCRLYVVRIGQDSMENPLKYSKPCPDCSKCIYNAGIKTVYYTTEFVCPDSDLVLCNIC